MLEQESQSHQNWSGSGGRSTDAELGLADVMEKLRALPSSLIHGTIGSAPVATRSAALPSQPPQEFGKYELLEETAQDNETRIFKAWDRKAVRFVTLRLI